MEQVWTRSRAVWPYVDMSVHGWMDEWVHVGHVITCC